MVQCLPPDSTSWRVCAHLPIHHIHVESMAQRLRIQASWRDQLCMFKKLKLYGVKL